MWDTGWGGGTGARAPRSVPIGVASARAPPGAGAAPGAGRASSAFTLSTSACASKGFVMWPSAPTRAARCSSKASKVPVSSSTGMCARAGSALIASQTS